MRVCWKKYCTTPACKQICVKEVLVERGFGFIKRGIEWSLLAFVSICEHVSTAFYFASMSSDKNYFGSSKHLVILVCFQPSLKTKFIVVKYHVQV